MTAKHDKILSLDGVSVAYKDNKVIDQIDLAISSGETFGLMGLNGVGKTTLIKAVLGLRDYDEGTIMVNGRHNLDGQHKKCIAYLPERFDPPWFLSGLEFIKFTMRLYGVPYDQEKVFQYSERLALAHDVLKNRVQTYSKGMRQKLGILANILSQSPVLILDEPMSGLDPRARTHVKDVLSEIRAEGRTIFMSSHILSDMNEICDRVAILHNHKLIFVGTPPELREEAGNDNLERAFMQMIERV